MGNATTKKAAKPVCPHCKTAMEPITFSHYYSRENNVFWECRCSEETFKKLGADHRHEGY